MATRFIQGGLDLDTLDAGTGPVPFGVEDDGGLAIRRGSVWKGANASDPGVERIAVQRVIAATGTTASLSVADNGATVIVSNAASCIVSLPATQKGLTYTLVVGSLPTGLGHALSPVAADKIIGNGFTPADDKDALCAAAGDRLGDSITVVGDGVDGWYITAINGTWTNP